ncbi:MAG: alpha/beta hydrolase [Pseudomonadota bacterium]
MKAGRALRRAASRVAVLALAAALAAALVWALAVAALWWRQEWLIFRPHTLPADWLFDKGPDVHERWIDVPGGRLNALHLRLPRPDGVVFYLHGNGGSLQGWFGDLDRHRRANLDLFMIDYRGYGKSPCCITGEGQLHADVRAAWEAMRRIYGDAAPQREVIVGNSLGTALAARLAAEEQPEQLVLIAPYTSMKALAAEHYPWVPRAVLRYPLATEEWIGRVRAPILLAHGGRDTLIEPHHSRRLQQLAPHAQLLLVPEARHHDLQAFPEYRDALWAALRGR